MKGVSKTWFSRVNEHVSLIALGLGTGIGFGVFVSIIMLCKKTRDWIIPPKIQPFYGVYKFPK